MADATFSATLSHNDVFNCSVSNYYGTSAGKGDISLDPQLIVGGPRIYLAQGSPCIDAGDNSVVQGYASGNVTEMDNMGAGCRINPAPPAIVDIGAAEYYGSYSTGTVATPTASPGAGTYDFDVNDPLKQMVVVLACSTPGAQIWYTLDGSAPTTDGSNLSSHLYSPGINGDGGIVLSYYDSSKSSFAGWKLRAQAFKPNYSPSDILSADYTLTESGNPVTTGGWQKHIDNYIMAPTPMLWIGGIHEPGIMVVNYGTNVPWQGGNPTIELQRDNGDGNFYDLPGADGGSPFYTDASGFTSPSSPPFTTYHYRARYTSFYTLDPGSNKGYTEWPYDTPPPPGTVIYGQCLVGDWAEVSVTPVSVLSSDSQTVDSRLDDRSPMWKPVNHNFGNNKFRGGLFAGYATTHAIDTANNQGPDSSREGRSFLKFQVSPQSQPGGPLWAASVNAYHTRSLDSAGTSSFPVYCDKAYTSSWAASSLNWSSALEQLLPEQAPQKYTFTASAVGSEWGYWPAQAEIDAALDSSQNNAVTFGLTGIQNEKSQYGQNPWAYFARRSASGTAPTDPHLLIGYGSPVSVWSLQLTPTCVAPGAQAFCTVTINGTSPMDTSVTISTLDHSSNYFPAWWVCVPGTVMVPAGQTTASFAVLTDPNQVGSCDIRANITSYDMKAQLFLVQ